MSPHLAKYVVDDQRKFPSSLCSFTLKCQLVYSRFIRTLSINTGRNETPAMLRNIVLFLVLALAAAEKCSKNCVCMNKFATCNTTNFGPFGETISRLKITNPKVPLILKNAQFNVSGLHNVESVTIEYATILDIDDAIFSGIPKLESFSISSSNIPRINNPLTFAKTEHLKILQIWNSTLTKFDSFRSKSLQELVLSDNLLTTISSTNFENLPSLTFINLNNNRISSINPNAFYKLTYLQDVLLSNNNITYLDPNTFANNLELTTIKLSGNPLKVIDLRLTSDLESLFLKSCHLQKFDESLSSNLLLLSFLDLSDNNMAFPPASLSKMKSLQYIDLSKNNMTQLNPRAFYFNTELQKLILDNNRFINFPKLESTKNFEIYYFSCSNCGISILLEDVFQYMSNVQKLNLSHNKITGQNLTAIQYLINLIELNLSYNNISIINPKSFMNSSSLRKINLSGNPISVINPNVFYYNHVLQYLDVTSCALERLWQQPVKRNLETLKTLKVANNRLVSVTQRDLQVVPTIMVLEIDYNSLECDAVTWLTKERVWPDSNKTKVLDNLVKGSNVDTEIITPALSWKTLTKNRCQDVENPTHIKVKGDIVNNIDDDGNYQYDDYNSKLEEDYASPGEFLEAISRVKSETKYSFLWPTLVFVFTALSVLIIGANVLLIILRSRAMPRHMNIPHIKIPRWNSNTRIKKYSGSVYQPLSEERTSEIFTANCSVLVPPKPSV
ncbi:hypothetical protein FQR65_LT02975 [Abscondita terminalis]|nr:hypothetical protein FQR65_LT02975 [Abscondita terminalis]